MPESDGEDVTPLWALWFGRLNAELVFSLISIAIVIFVLQTDLVHSNPLLFWVLALVDLAIVGFFVFILASDLSHTDDRGSWWRQQGWNLVGLAPVILAAFPAIAPIVLLRLIHVTRVYDEIMELLGLSQSSEHSDVRDQVQHLAFVVIALVCAGGFIAFLFEQHAYEACMAAAGDCSTIMHNLPEAMWWAVSTATTVGYGDYAPVTAGGRVVAVLLMITGIGVYGLLTATISQVLWAKGRQEAARSGEGLGSSEMISLLERLADMRRDGLLTEAEFIEAKASVLSESDAESLSHPEVEALLPSARSEREERLAAARAGFQAEE